jgi:hypothetical protein
VFFSDARLTRRRNSHGVAPKTTSISGGVAGEIFIAEFRPNLIPRMGQEETMEMRFTQALAHLGPLTNGLSSFRLVNRCISPPPTRLVALSAISVAVWPVRVCARVVDSFLFISILFVTKALTL